MDDNTTSNTRLNQDSNFTGHEACPSKSCNSSDAFARYDDGHGYCFSCGYYESKKGEVVKKEKIPSTLIDAEPQALVKRSINLNTCKLWDYGVAKRNGTTVQVATYRDSKGKAVAQKLRYPDKSFQILGDASKMGLWGQHLWQGGGRMVTITEGEIDSMSISQMSGNQYAVVSLPNGAQGAHKAIANSLEWLSTFDRVVLMFDQDEAGQKAVEKCASILPIGKAMIAKLPLKDANEMLVQGRGGDIVKAQWNAQPYRPDGVVLGEDLWDSVSEVDETESIPYPFAGMNTKTYGIRKGELVTLTSGTGIGKSSICRELAYHLITNDKKVGYIALEESVKRSALGIMGIHLNTPIHIHGTDVGEGKLKEAFDATMGTGNCVMYDHFGSMENDILINKIRYMVKALDVEYVFLDHISIVISSYMQGDERRRIDAVVTQLRSLVQELNISLIMVSHLKRPEGKAHEEGGKTSLAQLRGSASIGQLSDICFGFERDQQDELTSNITTVRVLKNRFSGETGICAMLEYDKDTGRLTESTATIAKPEGKQPSFV